MTIVVDANVAIAALSPTDRFHQSAIRHCVKEREVAILNVTRAEALIHPTRAGQFREADRELDALGFKTYVVDDATADRARQLRADYGSRNFPMIDAVVVAFGIERSWQVLTGDTKWPEIEQARVKLL